MHTASLTETEQIEKPRRACGVGLAVLFAWLAATITAAQADIAVKDVRLGNSRDAQRIVFDLSGSVGYKYFSLDNPYRLVLDLTDVDPGSAPLKALASQVRADDPFLAGLRVAVNRPGVTRVVADLKLAMRPLVSTYPASANQEHRLVVDLVPGLSVAGVLGKPSASPADKASVANVETTAEAVSSQPVQTAPETGKVAKGTNDQRDAASRSGKPAGVTKGLPAEVKQGESDQAGKPGMAMTERKKTQAVPTVKPEVAKLDTNKPAMPAGNLPVMVAVKPSASGTRVEKEAVLSGTLSGAVEPAASNSEKSAMAQSQSATVSVGLEKQVEQAIRQAGRPAADSVKLERARGDKAREPQYKRLVTIAIDAGHGGVDPGATGAKGSKEKDITLSVAKRLKAHIDAQEGMRAVLTRDGDTFIALHERVNKARRAQADLFVSIHADAFLKETARGSSVFALSEKGATSAAARWLAKRENEADLLGGINIDVKDVYLKRTLIDLSQTATIADSLKLGRAVLDELGEINDLHKAHVEQAGFAVLKAPDIPSILVETAFISNPEEEQRLLDEEYQERMAAAIVTGLRAYFENNPPLARSKVAQNL